jgi:hypothetical protein
MVCSEMLSCPPFVLTLSSRPPESHPAPPLEMRREGGGEGGEVGVQPTFKILIAIVQREEIKQCPSRINYPNFTRTSYPRSKIIFIAFNFESLSESFVNALVNIGQSNLIVCCFIITYKHRPLDPLYGLK